MLVGVYAPCRTVAPDGAWRQQAAAMEASGLLELTGASDPWELLALDLEGELMKWAAEGWEVYMGGDFNTQLGEGGGRDERWVEMCRAGGVQDAFLVRHGFPALTSHATNSTRISALDKVLLSGGTLGALIRVGVPELGAGYRTAHDPVVCDIHGHWVLGLGTAAATVEAEVGRLVEQESHLTQVGVNLQNDEAVAAYQAAFGDQDSGIWGTTVAPELLRWGRLLAAWVG